METYSSPTRNMRNINLYAGRYISLPRGELRAELCRSLREMGDKEEIVSLLSRKIDDVKFSGMEMFEFESNESNGITLVGVGIKLCRLFQTPHFARQCNKEHMSAEIFLDHLSKGEFSGNEDAFLKNGDLIKILTSNDHLLPVKEDVDFSVSDIHFLNSVFGDSPFGVFLVQDECEYCDSCDECEED